MVSDRRPLSLHQQRALSRPYTVQQRYDAISDFVILPLSLGLFVNYHRYLLVWLRLPQPQIPRSVPSCPLVLGLRLDLELCPRTIDSSPECTLVR